MTVKLNPKESGINVEKKINEILLDFQPGVDLDRTKFHVYIKLLELISDSNQQARAEERERVLEQIKNWAIETGKFDTAIQRDVVKYHELRNLLDSLQVEKPHLVKIVNNRTGEVVDEFSLEEPKKEDK